MKHSDEQRAVAMSNRQYGQLKYFQAAPKGVITLEEIAQLNQLTLGGNKRRKWVSETPDKHRMTITPEGRQAIRAFENADFFRKAATMKFSSFLDLEAYENSGPAKRRPASVHAMPMRARKAG